MALAGRQGADFIVYSGDLQNTPYKADEWFKTKGTASNADGLRWFEDMQTTRWMARSACRGRRSST
jgi:hypothetical protein